MYIHSFIHSYIQGRCTYLFNQCNEKAKIKTTDNLGNPTSYYSRCQEHHDQQMAYNKARSNRIKQEKAAGK